MANDKFYGYTPKYTKPSGKEGTIRSGAEEGKTYEHLGNPLDKVNPYEFRKGMDYELTALGCSRLKESTPEEREKSTATVIKNLESHPAYYSGLIQFESGMNHAGQIDGKNFKTWLNDHFEINKMKEVTNTSKDDKMTEPKTKSQEEPTKANIKMKALKEAIKNEIKNALKEQEDVDDNFDDDEDEADKAASKGAKKGVKAGKSNRFDAEKEAIKDLLYRGKKGSDSEFTEDEPAPKSILAVKDEMLQTYKTKFKGKEGGADEYNDLLKNANEKFLKFLEKHVKTFGEEGKGNNVTLDLVYGERLPDTIKLLGARLKELEKEEEAEVIAQTSERRKIAESDMTREQHIKLLRIVQENGISLREGSSGVKVYYEIAKAAYLEGLANGLRL
tara:strand:+ start:313 stop:1479 length:1167 start_codon:yes stop_codon:yes gene_type:complete